MRITPALVLLTHLLLGAAACSPSPEAGGASPCAAGDLSPAAVEVRLEPDAPLDAAPQVLRLHVSRRDEGPPLEASRFVLVDGELTPSQLGQLARDEVSQALKDRLWPTLSWSDEAGEVVVAPNVPLLPGGSYTLASGSPKLSVALRAAETNDTLVLPLVWPPAGHSLGQRVAIWCGSAALDPPVAPLPTTLMPGGEPGVLAAGGSAGGREAACVHFAPDGRSGVDAAVAPPALRGGSGELVALLDPTPLVTEQAPVLASKLSCEPGEIDLGPGCARVADDRLLLRTPDTPLLWILSTNATPPGGELVAASDGTEQLLFAPLEPASAVTLQLGVIDLSGGTSRSALMVDTLAPMPHVVINEVLANPIGPEPEQEWVELYNDGSVTAQLDGYALVDIGGHTALPASDLVPGQFALLVNEAFDEGSTYDPSPPSGTLLLRVESLGKGGLNNQGEPLELLDGDGHTVSRFPAEPKPKAGISIARTSPDAPDANPSSFARCADLPTPAAPNAQ